MELAEVFTPPMTSSHEVGCRESEVTPWGKETLTDEQRKGFIQS